MPGGRAASPPEKGREAVLASRPFLENAVCRRKQFPRGTLALGDAVRSFNPINGQGMTFAAQQAVALDSLLAGQRTDMAREFFGRIGKAIDTPWNVAVGNDLRMPETEGPGTQS